METAEWVAWIGAGATVFTGLAAVAGAMRVASNQGKILAEQKDLSAATLRNQMFERGLQSFETTADFLINFDNQESSQKRVEQFTTALRESQFLYGYGVFKPLYEILENYNTLNIAKHTANIKEPGWESTKNDALIDVARILKWKQTRLETLHEVYAPYLTVKPHIYEGALKDLEKLQRG